MKRKARLKKGDMVTIREQDFELIQKVAKREHSPISEAFAERLREYVNSPGIVHHVFPPGRTFNVRFGAYEAFLTADVVTKLEPKSPRSSFRSA